MKDIKIWQTSFNQEDVIASMDDDVRKKFEALSKKKQKALIEDYADSIARGLEGGLMSDWVYVMNTAIDCSGLGEAIEEASK